MQCALTDTEPGLIEADAVIGFVYQADRDSFPDVQVWDPLTGGLAGVIASRGEFQGKHHSTAVLHRPVKMCAERLLLSGCGPRSKASASRLRDCAGSAWRRLRSEGVKTVAVELPDAVGTADAVRAVSEGIILADYEPDTYKTSERKRSSLERLTIRAKNIHQDVLDRAVVTGLAQNRARELANEPGNLLPPRVLASRAQDMAHENGLEYELLDEQQLAALGMGALLGVARGSSEPPVMIVLRYRPETRTEASGTHLGLVGKAVTFDTGGISLKPPADMDLMKYDMAGGAAMIGAMAALASLHPAVPVTAVIPSVENMPGGQAQRPGDVVTTRSGKTVEVLNTDAEGRLILADALTYAKEQGCTHLVDAATLTGAIVVALGSEYTGLFSNDPDWQDRVLRASKEAGEKLWPMPLGEEYSKLLESPIADVANVGPRWGGAVTAAAFLEHFADKTPWVHLDIAGTAWYEKRLPHAPKGPSGVAVRTFVDLAMGLR